MPSDQAVHTWLVSELYHSGVHVSPAFLHQAIVPQSATKQHYRED